MNSRPADDIWRWTATRLSQAIKDREISAREAMQAILTRVQAVNPAVNALVEVLPEAALAAADEADKAVAKGDSLGPLHGVPVSTKINVAQQGTATSNGVVAFSDNIAAEDAPVIANLRRGGAIPFARSNVPSFSWRWFTGNELYGPTRNPHDPSITPGGSSGGAAVAVATGMGPLAHGSDLAGSIRYPAYACGVYGLKPSFGRVPNFDPGMPERPMLSQLLVTQGPLARSIDDLETALAVMEQPDARDPWHFVAAAQRRAQLNRVTLYRDAPGAHDHAVIDALCSAAAALTDAGYIVEVAKLPNMETVTELHLALLGEARHGLLDRIRRFADDAMRRVSESMFARAPPLTLEGYMTALALRSTLIRAWRMLLASTPLIIAPVCWKLPFPDNHDLDGELAVGAIVDSMMPSIAVNFLGFPALALPMGTAGSRPVGIQLIADRFDERRLFHAARAIEARRGPIELITPNSV